MESYYARRAAEYEKIYDKPERQADLARLRNDIPALFKGERVLEIACGTGYWTPLIARQAKSVLAVDYNEETLAIARTKTYPKGNVRFQRADAYALPDWPEKFSACYAGFWWSHVPLARLDSFLNGLQTRLEPGARVAFMDNRYVEGSSTAISRKDAQGNTYQRRRLDGGSSHEVLKNFPTAPELRARLGRFGTEVTFSGYEYYWLATYRIMAGTNPGGGKR
ncbi:MAG TPA: class I SAM-dependent methyltransferase [Burkholderiales bacterium]|jgi:demethylmenaquinone methyltransferase/2-methoxy-6-polyprenyl-1,4-benzoquinol methylase|nr:class I SAM-dependent methyltransferase [Burkholderiales bacterium]